MTASAAAAKGPAGAGGRLRPWNRRHSPPAERRASRGSPGPAPARRSAWPDGPPTVGRRGYGGDQQVRHLVEAPARRHRLDAHPPGRIGKRRHRLDHVLARQPIVVIADPGSQRRGGEGGKLRLKAARHAPAPRKFPARPEIIEQMRDRRPDQRVGEALQIGAGAPAGPDAATQAPSPRRRRRER